VSFCGTFAGGKELSEALPSWVQQHGHQHLLFQDQHSCKHRPPRPPLGLTGWLGVIPIGVCDGGGPVWRPGVVAGEARPGAVGAFLAAAVRVPHVPACAVLEGRVPAGAEPLLRRGLDYGASGG
jgi:hypothetical protein